MNSYRILYRGSLTSCNYSCNYCPFAKTKNSRAELAEDEQSLSRFVDWIGRNDDKAFNILITPWGEAIVRGYYRKALIALSKYSHVNRVSIQTNLTCNLQEFAAADNTKLAFWSTYHPDQTSLADFLKRCALLSAMNIRYSAGIVGIKEHFNAIQALRDALPPEVYVWVNAYKDEPAYYSEKDADFLTGIDPYFALNTKYYPSFGRSCAAGYQSFTVDGVGDVRRCHFIQSVIGNIYRDNIPEILKPTPCSNFSCECHIGYINLLELKLDQLFGNNMVERIPKGWPDLQPIPVLRQMNEPGSEARITTKK